jgi:transposase-like protein
MKKVNNPKPRYSYDFKLTVLKALYSGDVSRYRICRQYGISMESLLRWIRDFEEKSLSLPSELSELEKKVYMRYKEKQSVSCPRVIDERERLLDEISRLRKALEYSELRNEALTEVLRIGCEQYGIDLLKKAGAKQ